VTGGLCNKPDYNYLDHNQLSTQEYYEQVIRLYQPVICGGINTFFFKILDEYFNVDAFIINMGTQSNNQTHVATVICLNNRFYLFDAYYGCYFTDYSGHYLDLESIFKGVPFLLKRPEKMKFFLVDISNDTVKQAMDQHPESDYDVIAQLSMELQICQMNERVINSYLCIDENIDTGSNWKMTYCLKYLHFGSLLGLYSPSKETGDMFIAMLYRVDLAHVSHN
jgi:hypothetical protein